MKKLLALVMTVIMLLSAAALAEETQQITLGTTGIAMTVSADYASGEITAADTDESQVSYYKSESTLMDFDVYQWAKADGEKLADVAEAEAAQYGADAEPVTYGDMTVYAYSATEEYDGIDYATYTVMMENGDFFAELVFWLDGEDAFAQAEDMLNTLTAGEAVTVSAGGYEIVLGTTHLQITTPVEYVKGEITAADTDENQVAYYKSEESLIDFDVYQWARAEGENAEIIADAEAAEFGSEIFEDVVNGIVIDGYYAQEEYDGQTYETCTIIFEDEDIGQFVELVFWLDGEDAALKMTEIVGTLTHI